MIIIRLIIRLRLSNTVTDPTYAPGQNWTQVTALGDMNGNNLCATVKPSTMLWKLCKKPIGLSLKTYHNNTRYFSTSFYFSNFMLFQTRTGFPWYNLPFGLILKYSYLLNSNILSSSHLRFHFCFPWTEFYPIFISSLHEVQNKILWGAKTSLSAFRTGASIFKYALHCA